MEEVYAPIIDTQMTISDALKQVFLVANANKTSSKGFNQASKAILGKKAIFVVVTKDYESSRLAIIKKLCENMKIPVIELATREELGSIVGFAKSKKEGNEDFTGCGVATLNSFVYQTDGRFFVENYLRDVKA